jgi:hemolysin III
LSWLNKWLLEPVNALTHLAGALASLGGLVLLVNLTRGQTAKMLSLAVYCLSMVAVYSASALLHGARLPQRFRFWLNRLDHAAIFWFIAGTYTPIVYNLFPPGWRWPVLGAVWGAALAGTLYKLASPRIHGLFNASVYPLLAWSGIVPGLLAYRLKPLVPLPGLGLLFLGGLIYMAGFVIYYRRRPDPWPQTFGHHEIWHVFVIGGSLAHFLFMVWYVAPAPAA